MKRWKPILLVGSAFGLGVAVFAIWITLEVGRHWSDMGRTIAQMIAEVRAQSTARPPLYGEPETGNAWEDYQQAESQMRVFPDFYKVALLAERPRVPGQWEEALEKYRGTLALLRRGAGRLECRYPYAWELGSKMTIPDSLGTYDLTKLMLIASRVCGEGRAAAEQLLDLLQYGRDLGDDGPMSAEVSGGIALGMGLDEIRGRLVAKSLNLAAIALLEQGLERLDGSYPSQLRIVDRITLAWALELRDPGALNPYGRISALKAFRVVREVRARAAGIYSRPCPEEQAMRRHVYNEWASTWNPDIFALGMNLIYSSQDNRGRRTHVRLLRAALSFLRSGEIPLLTDPGGTALRSSRERGRLKVWAVGEDGVDNGGDGDWGITSRDIVLEVER